MNLLLKRQDAYVQPSLAQRTDFHKHQSAHPCASARRDEDKSRVFVCLPLALAILAR